MKTLIYYWIILVSAIIYTLYREVGELDKKYDLLEEEVNKMSNELFGKNYLICGE